MVSTSHGSKTDRDCLHNSVYSSCNSGQNSDGETKYCVLVIQKMNLMPSLAEIGG